MSGRHWLERDPKNSPGLQRIREAQQAVAIAKERVTLTEIQRKQDLENFRLKFLAQATIAEQRVAELKPLLEEVESFAVETGTFPIGIDPEELRSPAGESLTKTPRIELVHPSMINVSRRLITKVSSPFVDGQIKDVCKTVLPGWSHTYDSWGDSHVNKTIPEPEIEIEVVHGFKGIIVRGITGGDGDSYNSSTDTEESNAAIEYGIRIRVGSDGSAKLLQQNITNIPQFYSRGITIPEHKGLRDSWISIPDDDRGKKQLLAEAFHNPAYLGAKEFYIPTEPTFQPVEPQANTGIADLVKGFLGLK